LDQALDELNQFLNLLRDKQLINLLTQGGQ
jgi:hypothetical protein